MSNNREEGNVIGGEFSIGGANPEHYQDHFVDVNVVGPLEFWSFNFESYVVFNILPTSFLNNKITF